MLVALTVPQVILVVIKLPIDACDADSVLFIDIPPLNTTLAVVKLTESVVE